MKQTAIRIVLVALAMQSLSGCLLSLGTGTGIGNNAGVSTSVTLDTQTGQIDPDVGAHVVIR